MILTIERVLIKPGNMQGQAIPRRHCGSESDGKNRLLLRNHTDRPLE